MMYMMGEGRVNVYEDERALVVVSSCSVDLFRDPHIVSGWRTQVEYSISPRIRAMALAFLVARDEAIERGLIQ